MESGNLMVLLALAICGAPPDTDLDRKEDAAGTQESARRVLELAKQYEFFAGSDRRTKFELQPKPLLRYSNPVRGDVHGNVFVWTRKGRPEVVGAFFDFRSENKLDSELHILATAGVAGWRDGKEFWNPAKAGTRFMAVPKTQNPAGTPPAACGRCANWPAISPLNAIIPSRARAICGSCRSRSIAIRVPMRMSSTARCLSSSREPIPRPTFSSKRRRGEKPRWEFAFARMNIVQFAGAYKGEVVWSVDAVSWDEVFDRHEPYAIIREQPRRGLVRSR